ncbi:MAG: holo-ACP synthase [Candidatus Cloacimonetes bacterium]|jgi:holo-[acyl-carrier protein] synthase|nr:holo-ACP synthase [Candidatus Cloacimonadota bacterium]HPM00976.1 holo-ACP synthase [Candidatus Cloacimonadota bacterium]
MPIFGIGTDIIEVQRVQKAISKSQRFKERVFTEEEIALCENKSNPWQSYAARFAAKEAMLKAMGTGWSGGIEWKDISVEHNEHGKPIIKVYNRVSDFCQANHITQIHLSLTHIKELAMAYVILEIN